MESIVNMLIGESTTFDVYVVVRLIVFALCLEFISLICAYLGGMKK